MAALTFFMTDNLADVYQEMSETSPGSEAYASPATGWIVGTTAAGNYASFNSQVEAVATEFGATVQPDGSLEAVRGDAWRSLNTYDGTFDTGDWEFHAAVRAQTNASGQDGNAGFRLFRSANADGSGATEITAARHEGATVTDLLTSVTQDSNVNVNISTFSLSNEYLFVQLAWEVTGAATMPGADVNFRIGTGASRLVTPNFTPAGGAADAKLLSLLGVGQ